MQLVEAGKIELDAPVQRYLHWFRVADGKVIEHWANRDDLGTAMQLGWTPPSPLYLVRMLLATRRARREPGR